MTNIDVSILVTFHKERQYAKRTLTSLSDAAAVAREKGLSVELIAVFDRADAATKGVFAKADVSAYNVVRQSDVDFGSLGRSRNFGCSLAKGTYINIADGDDLVSSTYIVRMFEEARLRGEAAVINPRFVLGFGDRYFIVEYFSQDSTFSAGMINQHLYTAKILFHRSLVEKVQYADLPLQSGYAYEDWHFNCEAMAAGYKFYVADKAIGFYRQRPNSLLREADRISARQIPPSRLFAPPTYLRLFAEVMGRSRCKSHFIGAGSGVGLQIFQDTDVLYEIYRANKIDPAVDIGRYYWHPQGNFNNLPPTEIGAAYYRLCELVGRIEFDEVVFLPDAQMASGGRQMIDAVVAHASDNRTNHVLALSEIPFESSFETLGNLSCVTAVDLLGVAPRLDNDSRDILCLKLMQACASSARILLSFSGLGARFIGKFGHLLHSNRVIYYRGRAMTLMEGPSRSADTEYEFIAENIELLDEIVVPNAETMRSDLRRLRYGQSKWQLGAETHTA